MRAQQEHAHRIHIVGGPGSGKTSFSRLVHVVDASAKDPSGDYRQISTAKRYYCSSESGPVVLANDSNRLKRRTETQEKFSHCYWELPVISEAFRSPILGDEVAFNLWESA